MIYVPGGTFRMGYNRHYADEAPVHRVTVDVFWVDRVPVTNREFRKFVNATGYVTFAEIAPDLNDYPDALPNSQGGARWFSIRRDMRSIRTTGASGGHSSSAPTGDDPTVREVRSPGCMIIPSFTSRSGMPWPMRNGPARICRLKRNGSLLVAAGSTAPNSPAGIELTPRGEQMANTWQGAFPHENLKLDGYERTTRDRVPAEWLWRLRHEGSVGRTTDGLGQTRGGRPQGLLYS